MLVGAVLADALIRPAKYFRYQDRRAKSISFGAPLPTLAAGAVLVAILPGREFDRRRQSRPMHFLNIDQFELRTSDG